MAVLITVSGLGILIPILGIIAMVSIVQKNIDINSKI